MTKVFAKSNMMSNDVQSYVVSAKFYDTDGNAAEINDGAFLVLGDHDDNVVYGTKDYNVYKAAAPTADNQVVVVVDLDGISQGVIAGNNYKIGQKTTDLICRPGFPFRVRRLAMYDQFWLGEGGADDTETD